MIERASRCCCNGPILRRLRWFICALALYGACASQSVTWSFRDHFTSAGFQYTRSSPVPDTGIGKQRVEPILTRAATGTAPNSAAGIFRCEPGLFTTRRGLEPRSQCGATIAVHYPARAQTSLRAQGAVHGRPPATTHVLPIRNPVMLTSASTAVWPMSTTNALVIPTRVEESLVRRRGGPMRQLPMDALLTQEGLS